MTVKIRFRVLGGKLEFSLGSSEGKIGLGLGLEHQQPPLQPPPATRTLTKASVHTIIYMGRGEGEA